MEVSMRRFINKISVFGAGLLITLALPFAALAQNNNSNTTDQTRFTVTPWTYVGAAGDCGPGYPAGTQNLYGGMNVVSRWVNDMGNPAPSLYLQKAAATTDCSAAGATINHVDGITLTELNFDYNSSEYCGGGAPRFNVVTSDNVTHFFGCNTGTATASTTNPDWTHVTFNPSDPGQAFPIIASGVTVKSIDIVFDEHGFTHIDNISVNDQVIGRGSTPFHKDDCKNGGYKNFADNNGDFFKNQGQCVSFVEHNQHQMFKNKDSLKVQDAVQHASANSNTSTGTY
jgi:hypothetical protein